MGDEIDPELIKKTQDLLGQFIRKPQLTDKLLRRPPFRFIHDIITSVIANSDFMGGLYEQEELNADNIKDKEAKAAFLQKAVDVVSLVSGDKLSVRPGKIIAGLEADKTNEFLQCLAKALQQRADSAEAVRKVLQAERPTKGSPLRKSTTKPPQDEARGDTAQKGKESESVPNGDIPHRSKTKRDDLGDKRHDRKSEEKKVDAPSKVEKTSNQTESSKKSHHKEKPPHQSTRDKERPVDRQLRPSHASSPPKEHKPSVREPAQKTRPAAKGHASKTDINGKTPVRGAASDVAKLATDSRDRRKMGAEQVNRRGSTLDVSSQKRGSIDAGRKRGSVDAGHRRAPDRKDMGDAGGSRVMGDRHVKSKAEPVPHIREIIRVRDDDAISNNALILGGENGSPKTNNSPVHSASKQKVTSPVSTARPSTARAPPPRIRPPSSTGRHPEAVPPTTGLNLLMNQQLPVTSGNRTVANVISEVTNQDVGQETGDDVEVLVDEQQDVSGNYQSISNALKSMSSTSVLDETEQEHGSLVTKILETKKELSDGRRFEIDKSQLMDTSAYRKAREAADKELSRLREGVQEVTKAAHQLGKMTTFAQEDVEVMQRELKEWTDENSRITSQLNLEQKQTDESLEPLRQQLAELEQKISQKKESICYVKSNIFTNEETIKQMISTVRQ